MDKQLPLKLRLSVRKHWDAAESDLQTARRELKDTLGRDVLLLPEWSQLLAVLNHTYADRGDLVVAVCGSVAVWCRLLAELLESADQEEEGALRTWLDTVLERTKPQGLKCLIEISHTGTSWSPDKSAFVIHLPKTAIVLPSALSGAFRDSILHCFDAKPRNITGKVDASDDWADVDVDTSGTADVVDVPQTLPTAAITTSATTSATIITTLPTAESLPCPDTLLLRPPYYLTIVDYGRCEVEVHGSHSPSLELLHDYLVRWCRVNHNSTIKPPVVTIKLHESCWATGALYDRLTLKPQNPNYEDIYFIHPAILLAFIEGVLGYVSVPGKTWVFRRDVPFV